MIVQYYSKADERWHEARIVSAIIVPKDEEDGFNIYGDNLRSVPLSKDPYGLKQDEWPWWEVFMGWFMFGAFCIAIACGIKYLIS